MIETSNGGTPAWATLPLDRFVAYTNEDSRLVDATKAALLAMPRQAEALPDALRQRQRREGRGENEEDRRLLAQARDRATFVRDEVERDFPALHARSVVALWGALETLVDDFFLALLLNDPRSLHTEAIGNLKVSLKDFLTREREEQMQLILDALKEQKGRRAAGVNGFEEVANTFGLGATRPIDSGLRQDLIEMYQVRNVIVHKGAVADRRFVETCGWVGASIGQRIRVNSGDHARFLDSVVRYADLIRDRAGIFYASID